MLCSYQTYFYPQMWFSCSSSSAAFAPLRLNIYLFIFVYSQERHTRDLLVKTKQRQMRACQRGEQRIEGTQMISHVVEMCSDDTTGADRVPLCTSHSSFSCYTLKAAKPQLIVLLIIVCLQWEHEVWASDDVPTLRYSSSFWGYRPYQTGGCKVCVTDSE